MKTPRSARILLPPLSATLWILLHACAPSDDGPPRVVQRDSAGIAVVESFRPAWGDSAHWRVDPESLLDLAESGTGDPHNFYSVRGIRRLSDESLVVANRGSHEIRKFSADGNFVRSGGGSGEGPGEFTNLQRIELAGDSILALDFDGGMAVFGPDLELVRTMRPDPGAEEIRYLGDGIMVAEVWVPDYDGVGLVRHSGVLLLFDLEGAGGDTIGWTPGWEEYVGEVLSAPPLFGKASVLDTHGGRIFVGSSDQMQIEELDTHGDTVRILRIPNFPLALTAAQVQAERDSRFDIPLPPGVESLPPPFVAAIEDMPSPETRPAYSDMLVDPTGAVWLRPFRGISEQGGPEYWLVLGADGIWLGSVEVPEDFRVMDIGMDEILGVWTDGMDVQHPQVRHLSRGGVEY